MRIRAQDLLTPERLRRFWSRVKILDSASCWEWQGSCPQFGVYRVNYGKKKAFGYLHVHRIAYMLATGERLTNKQIVIQTCGNRRCVNPAHLLKNKRWRRREVEKTIVRLYIAIEYSKKLEQIAGILNKNRSRILESRIDKQCEEMGLHNESVR